MAAAKRTKAAPTDDELGELFEGIGPDTASKKSSKPKPTSAAAKAIADQDILAELENELSAQTPPSRPHTPRIRDHPGAKGTPGRKSVEDRSVPRKSTESASSLRASFTPSATSSDLYESEKKAPAGHQQQQQQQQAQQGGGWWGNIFSTATAAMKTAEAAVKDLQQSEEAKKWTEQVKGNVGVLRGFGDELRHRAMPTFTNILHTLAPPISSHERLHIHITHDLVGYPSLDPMIHDVFGRVMSQVEGGDLLVIQRGQEMTGKRSSGQDATGWRDGPWWRAVDPPRDMGIVKGLSEATKLCRANAEGYANEYFASRGGIEEARVRATEPLSATNPVRTSDLFLSVQAVGLDADNALFARTAAVEKEKEDSTIKAQDLPDELVCFAVFILDPVHEIEYSTLSQSIPARWIKWLDAPSPLTPTSGDDTTTDSQSEAVAASYLPATTPEEIREIVEAGGVDPREWVAEWVEESLSLATGIVAQRYVARRMGVGEGGIGRGKKRMEELVQDGAGEAARAGLI